MLRQYTHSVKCYNRTMEKAEEYIRREVHRLYWEHDENCARTTLRILSGLTGIAIGNQTLAAASGLHGAGGYGAQCGLVEGALMFIVHYGNRKGLERDEIVKLCHDFASEFERNFSSLRCRELRPGGFSPDDPPHLCEGLSVKAIQFSYEFLKDHMG